MEKRITIGLDMGDKNHVYCMLDDGGEILNSGRVGNTRESLTETFGELPPSLIALETGTHSAWTAEFLTAMGHEVIVGNSRKLRMIWGSDVKNDAHDAEMLARLARSDRKLLHPISHRGPEARLDLAVLKARNILVNSRKQQISHIRGIVKSHGERIVSCDADNFARHAREEMPAELLDTFVPVIESIELLTNQIKAYDKQIRKLCQQKYPETAALQAVVGVGPITALAYILTLEDPGRFSKSRDVGAFLGLVPRQDQSGGTDKQLSITKAGNRELRCLLVGSAQYILSNRGPDCLLRRAGLRLAARGGKNAKKRAVVAVARKLAVLLHRLWSEPQLPYNPFYEPTSNNKKRKAA